MVAYAAVEGYECPACWSVRCCCLPELEHEESPAAPVTAAQLNEYWTRENATRRAAFAYVVALAGGAGVFACDTRTWWGFA